MKNNLAFVAIFIIFLILLSCHNNVESNQNIKVFDPSECVPYFDFDKIEHYYTDIDEEKVWDSEKSKTEREKKLLNLLIQDTLSDLSDTTALKDIEKLDFKKKDVPSDKFSQINKIFCERKHTEIEETSCEAFYRDIFVFKKKNKIIGTAKICFSCDKNIIAGTKLNTNEFGQSGDYGRLAQILNR